MNPRHIPTILFVSTFCSPFAIAEPQTTNSSVERNATPLEGVWSLAVKETFDTRLKGDSLPENLRGLTRTFDGNRMTLASRTGKIEFSFTVNDSATPKELDIVMKNRDGKPSIIKAIYRLEGHILKIAERSVTRPTSFKPTEETRFTVTTYRRHRD